MTQYARLQLFSKIVRLLIWLAAFILALVLMVEYGLGVDKFEWTSGDSEHVFDISTNYHPKYHELRQLDGVNLWLLSLYPLTAVAFPFVILYFLQQLFGFYVRGQFFHQGTTRCYLVLVWAFIFRFFFDYFEEYILWLFYPDKTDVSINATVNFGEFGILLVLLVVAYVLKIANQIDKENKEFI